MNTFFQHLKAHLSFAGGLLIILIAASGAAVYYFSDAATLNAVQPPAQPPQTPSVDVVTVQPRSVRFWNEFSGRLRAVDHVEVRPRVSGTITHVLFEEGAIVEKGDLLFVIDRRPYEAEVASARAALQSAQSQARLAKLELERTEGLVHEKAVSQSRYDVTKNDFHVALTLINSAKARLKQAYLDLDYAHINAPVSGRISRAEITVGNVIEAGANAPILTTIVSIDKLYAEFDVDEQTYLKSMRHPSEETMPVELALPGDTGMVYQGKLHSFDNRLDTTSGTIRARAIFDNTDGVLIPGMYADIRLGSPRMQSTILLNHRAVRTDQDKKYVYVVTPDNKVAYREVDLGLSLDGHRVVHSGLEVGEQVLINSLQRVRPDTVVQPIDVSQIKDNSA